MRLYTSILIFPNNVMNICLPLCMQCITNNKCTIVHATYYELIISDHHYVPNQAFVLYFLFYQNHTLTKLLTVFML